VRDAQFSELVKDAVRALETGFGTNFWMHGKTGLGKTLTALFFKQYAEEKGLGRAYGKEVRVFCFAFSAVSVRKNVEEFCRSLGHGKAGGASPAGALIRAVEGALTRDLGSGGERAHVVIIFDDVDKVRWVWKTDLSNFLHDLIDGLTVRRRSFSVHLISTENSLNARGAFSEPAWSRLQPVPLGFPPYNKDEVALLLEQRLRPIEGLEWDEKAVKWMAEEVANSGGDFRRALRLVRAVIAKTGKLTWDEALDVAIQVVDEERADAIMSLGRERALLVRALVEVLQERIDRLGEGYQDFGKWEERVREMERSGALVASWEDVKERYWTLCEELGIAPKTEDVLYKWLRDHLEPFGVDVLRLRKRDRLNYKGKYGTFLRLRIPFEPTSRAVRLIDWSEPW
jgi:Cdc6-like AAA superfamily ATPase